MKQSCGKLSGKGHRNSAVILSSVTFYALEGFMLRNWAGHLFIEEAEGTSMQGLDISREY
jgi:hypothetical protein